MSKQKRDYYTVLGVSRDASDKSLKRAYRKKAMQYHPDKYDGPKSEAEEKFKELNEAYSILSDSRQRDIYNRFGHAGLEGAGASARAADPFDFFSSIFDLDLSDLFGGGYGRSRARSRPSGPSRGDDVLLDLQLSFEEAFDGVSKKITMPFNSPCKECIGTRAAKGSGFKTCNKCHGSGTEEHQVQRGFFVQISRQVCSKCKGAGRLPEKVCPSCKGSGQSNKKEEIKIKIPRGINNGEAIRVQGKGRPSRDGGLPGDLIFRIHLKDHDIFERNDLDVYMKLHVDYPTMVLGGKIDVPLISGKEEERSGKLKVPKGTALNDVLRISGAGFRRKIRGNDVAGDMYFVVTLKVPKKLTKRQKEILQELRTEMN